MEQRTTVVEMAEHPFLMLCKLTLGVSVEPKAPRKMQKCKISSFNSKKDYKWLTWHISSCK